MDIIEQKVDGEFDMAKIKRKPRYLWLKRRKATLSTIKLKDGKKLYMASLGGEGYWFPTKSKTTAKRQVRELRANELNRVSRR